LRSVATTAVVIVLCLQSVGFGQKTEPSILQETYEKAQRAFLTGDLEAARAALDELLKARSDIPEAYNLLGAIYARQGDSRKAVSNFKKAVTLRPGYSEAVDNLSLHLIRSGQAKQAIGELQGLLRLDSASTSIHTWLGRVHFQTGEFSKAVSHLERVKAPSGLRTAEIETILGSSYLQLGDENRARKHLEKAVSSAQKNELAGEAWLRLGILLTRQGDQKKAIEAFQRATGIEPQKLEAQLGLAQAYFRSSQFQECLLVLKRLPNLDSTPEALNLFGATLSKVGEQGKAETVLRRAIEQDPQNHDAYYNLALVLLKKESTTEAITVFQKAVALFPKSQNLITTLGIAYQLNGELEAARGEFNRLLSFYPSSSQAHLLLGSSYLESGQHLLARSHLEKSDALDSNNAKTCYLLGLVHSYLGNSEKSQAYLERTTKLDSSFCFAFYQLAKGELERNHNAALEYSRKAAACDPGFAQPHYQMSQIYANIGQKELAEKEMRLFQSIQSKIPDRKYQVFVLP